jgi:hypothetical protein
MTGVSFAEKCRVAWRRCTATQSGALPERKSRAEKILNIFLALLIGRLKVRSAWIASAGTMWSRTLVFA